MLLSRSFAFYISVCDPFWINFLKSKVCVQLHSFACGCPVVPVSFVETIFTPLYYLCYFCQVLVDFIWVYFWALYSFYWFIFLLIPQSWFPWFYSKYWSWVVSVLQLYPSPSILGWPLGLLSLHKNFRISLSKSTKLFTEIFLEIA